MKSLPMSISEVLVNQSAITRRQLETLLSYVKVASGEMTLKEAASETPKGVVTIGSYYRTVNQARRNVRESLVTVLISLWLGLVKVEDVRRLFELVGAGAELSEEERGRFVEVLQALLDKMIL